MPLRILNYAWHVGHQYELYRLPHRFVLLTGDGFRRWNFRTRPLRPNVELLPVDRVADWRAFDLAILHFDEQVLEPPVGRAYPFRRLLERLEIPIIAICHGPAPFLAGPGASRGDGVAVDEARRSAIAGMVGTRALVVTNSLQAEGDWRFARSRTIWHGLDPDEYPETSYERKVLTIVNSFAQKPVYQGHRLYKEVSAGLPCDYLGKDPAAEFRRVPPPRPVGSPWRLLFKAADALGGDTDAARGAPGLRRAISDGYGRAPFRVYRDLIARYSIYFNPTRLSPMPRSRLEALFCGLALVTTSHHDVGRWLEDGVTGFMADDPATLRGRLKELCDDPGLCRKLGEAGRQMARERFHVRHYLKTWHETIEEVLGTRA